MDTQFEWPLPDFAGGGVHRDRRELSSIHGDEVRWRCGCRWVLDRVENGVEVYSLVHHCVKDS